jgi:CoA-transferase family III
MTSLARPAYHRHRGGLRTRDSVLLLGLGPAQVAKINPRCVYVSISAYGGGSELEDRPGIDMIVQPEARCLSGQPQDRLERLSIAVTAWAGARAALSWTLDYITERKAFGRPAMYLAWTWACHPVPGWRPGRLMSRRAAR